MNTKEKEQNTSENSIKAFLFLIKFKSKYDTPASKNSKFIGLLKFDITLSRLLLILNLHRY